MTLTRLTNLFKDNRGTFMYPEYLTKEYLFFMEYLEEFQEQVKERMFKQYVDKEQEDVATLCRPSSLGKVHIADLLLSKFDPTRKEILDEKTKLIFSIGDYLEAWVGFTLRRLGYKVINNQEVTDGLLKGSVDYIVTDDDGSLVVLEVKSASDYYFNKVIKWGVDDERGYLTQLSIYHHLTGLPCYWLFINKDTADMAMIPLSYAGDVVLEKIRKAQYHAETYNNFSEQNPYFLYCLPPAPAIEKNKAGEYQYHDDGSLRLYPSSLCLYPHIYYELFEGKTLHNRKRTYVKSFVHYDSDIDSYAINFDARITEEKVTLSNLFQKYLKA